MRRVQSGWTRIVHTIDILNEPLLFLQERKKLLDTTGVNFIQTSYYELPWNLHVKIKLRHSMRQGSAGGMFKECFWQHAHTVLNRETWTILGNSIFLTNQVPSINSLGENTIFFPLSIEEAFLTTKGEPSLAWPLWFFFQIYCHQSSYVTSVILIAVNPFTCRLRDCTLYYYPVAAIYKGIRATI